jgi:hypothetical protein
LQDITLILFVVGFGFQFGSLDGLESPVREQNRTLLWAVAVGNCSLDTFKLTLCHKLESITGTNALPRYDFIFKTLWYYIPGLLLDLVRYLPTSQYRGYRSYLMFMRNFSQGIIEKSIIEGDGKDIMSVLLRANASEDPMSRLSDTEMVDQIAYVNVVSAGSSTY